MEQKGLPFPKFSENFRKDQQWITKNGVGEGHCIGSNADILSSNLGDSTIQNKRVEHEINAANFQLVESGAIPTDTLHLQGTN